jgi:hypothetical protein
MKLQTRARVQGDWVRKALQWVNLRPEEGERTLLMFAFYTATSVGWLWFEYSAVALFLDKYGAERLPLIYIVGAFMVSGLGVLYSWLSGILPMRSVLVTIALLTSVPLLLFRVAWDSTISMVGFALATVFLVRLWSDAG